MNQITNTYSHLDPHSLQRHNNNYFEELQPGKSSDKESIPQTGIFNTQDKVSMQYNSETSVTYTSSLTMNNVVKGDGFEMLRELVASMLEEQGIEFQAVTGSGKEIDLKEMTPEEAQELISEDGYFGVDQTSTRIVDFAIAAAGGDPSRLDAIKEGVEKGFNEAKEAFGGWLPDISFETFDTVMEKLDTWAESEKDNQVV